MSFLRLYRVACLAVVMSCFSIMAPPVDNGPRLLPNGQEVVNHIIAGCVSFPTAHYTAYALRDIISTYIPDQSPETREMLQGMTGVTFGFLWLFVHKSMQFWLESNQ